MPSPAEQRLKDHAIQSAKEMLIQRSDQFAVCKDTLVGEKADHPFGARMSERHFEMFSESILHHIKEHGDDTVTKAKVDIGALYDFTSELAQQIEFIDRKIEHLTQSGNTQAVLVAERLRDTLRASATDLVNENMDVDTFKVSSTAAVDTAIPELRKHLGRVDPFVGIHRILSVIASVFGKQTDAGPKLSQMKTLLQGMKSGETEDNTEESAEQEVHKPSSP